MTSRQLATLGRRWQRRLRLADWRVGFQFAPELDGKLSGCVEFDRDAREAVVSIARECEDVEGTVIHELLHLHFAAPRGEPQEQAINAVAGALVTT